MADALATEAPISTADVLRPPRVAGDDPLPPPQLAEEPPGTPATSTLGGGGLGSLAFDFFNRSQDAGRRIEETMRTSAAEQAPALDAAEARVQEIGDRAQTRAAEVAALKPTITAPPSVGLRGFLAPGANETPEATVSKLLAAVSVFATGLGGLAMGNARGSLSALVGAMAGWQEGDRERAAREYADWKAKTDAALQAWQVERQSYEDEFKAANLSIDAMFKGLQLKAYKANNLVAADLFAKGDLTEASKWLGERQDAAANLQALTAKIDHMRTQQVQAERDFLLKLSQLEETIRHNRATEEGKSAVTPQEVDRLRDDFLKESKSFSTVRDAYGRVVASGQGASPASDLSMIFSFMKMLDPGSVVREGEQATAANARGVDESVRSLYNRMLTGEKLTPGQRADFLGQAGRLWQREVKTHEDREVSFRKIADERKISHTQAIPDLVGSMRTAQPPSGPAKSWPEGLPDPATEKGQTFKGKTTGKSWYSDGVKWVERGG